MQHQCIPVDAVVAGFGANWAGTHLPGFTGITTSPWLIPINPDYVFDQTDANRILCRAWCREWERTDNRHRKGVYLFGPTGSGKTSIVEQFFARLKVPLVKVTWSPRREADDLLHSKTLVDGTLLNVEQAITLAARNGYPVLIDEVDLADPGELAALNEVIERGLIATPDGTTIRAAQGFIIFCTGNTAGAEDEEGTYHGTRSQNAAFLRRFFAVRVGYPDEAAELAFLKQQVPDASDPVLACAARTVIKLRQAYEGTTDNVRLSASISRPEAVDWVEMMGKMRHLIDKGIHVAEYTLGFTFTNRLTAADRRAAQEILKSCFNVGGSVP